MMARRNPSEPTPARPPSASSPLSAVTSASLASLIALGAANALWALFLWSELVLARAGGMPFCDLGGQSNCAAVWDSALAGFVHATTGLPIAGWGLVFGLVTLALPLIALTWLSQGRDVSEWVSAIRWTAAAGAVTVILLLVLSAVERVFCIGCFGTYLLVSGYAGIALLGWPGAGLPRAPRGLALAACATVAAFLLLLYPGLRTPRAVDKAGRAAVGAALGQTREPGAGTGDPTVDRQLTEFVTSLKPEMKQVMSDSLFIYRSSPAQPAATPRVAVEPKNAPVRIVEFTDIRCEHCADLHETISSLRQHLPEGSFSVESRQFPLDGECNPLVRTKADPVRCLAAKARICLEGHDKAFEFTGALFAEQATLTRDRVYEIAAPYLKRSALEVCVASPDTQREIEADVEYAARFDSDGTPIVVINDRKATSFAPFLFAMVLARGADSHPAFASLPAPNPRTHLH